MNRRPSTWLKVLFLVVMAAIPWLWRLAQPLAPSRTPSTGGKREVGVPTEDGRQLPSEVHFPEGVGPWPAVLIYTPFPGDRTEVSAGIKIAQVVGSGIVVVVQRTREPLRSEDPSLSWAKNASAIGNDGVETVAWLRRQPWCNGRIATVGGSDAGTTQLLLAARAPRGIVGQHVSGAPTTLPQDRKSLASVRWPMVHVGGWFNGFAQSTIDRFVHLQERGASGARGRQHLVMGPWSCDPASGMTPHRSGALTFPKSARFPGGAPTPAQWLGFWLSAHPRFPAREPAVRYYVIGDLSNPRAPGNVWRSAPAWPPPSRPLRLYLTPDRFLKARPPDEASTAVCAIDLDDLPVLPREAVKQREITRGRDIFVFRTPPLAAPLEVTGRVSIHLSTADLPQEVFLTARFADLYPDGRSMLLAEGMRREGRGRDEGTCQQIDLGSTSIIFGRGHRLVLAISAYRVRPARPASNPHHRSAADDGHPPKLRPLLIGGATGSHLLLPEAVGSGARSIAGERGGA